MCVWGRGGEGGRGGKGGEGGRGEGGGGRVLPGMEHREIFKSRELVLLPVILAHYGD